MSTRRGLCRLLAVALAAIAPLAPAAAQTSGPACELHLWGAVPDYGPHPRFDAPGAPKGSPEADRSNPIANINTLDPVQRLRGVDDAVLARLLPGAQVTVIRHPAPIFIDRAQGTRRRLATSSADCYADFVLLGLYDLEGKADWAGSPSLTGLLAAAGLHATYVLHRFTGAELTAQARHSWTTPLTVPRSEWPRDSAAAIAALDRSVAMGVARFAGVESQ